MKIGFDAKRLFNNWTGLGAYSRTLLTNLDHYYPEHEFWLYTTRLPDRAELTHFRKSPFFPVLPTTRFRSWWRTFGLTRQLQSDEIDLYHGLSNELPVGLARTDIPSVVTIHDLIFRRLPETYSLADRQIYDYKFREACQQADRIIAISQSTKADIVADYDVAPEKVQVIYQSCDPVFYREPYEEVEARTVLESYGIPDEYLLYVGSIIPRKNLLGLVRALGRIPAARRLPLVVVGRGKKYQKEVARYAAENGLTDWINWQPDVLSTHDLKAIYELARGFVYPSIYEGFGIPVVEAALSKVPVVTSDRASLPEAAGPDAWVVDPSDEEQLTDALGELLAGGEAVEQRVERSYQYAQDHFAPKETTGQMMALYRELVGAV